MIPHKAADIPERVASRLEDLDHKFQIVARRSVDGGPWDYTLACGARAVGALQAAQERGTVITHHMRAPGGSWLLVARLARDVARGSVRPWPDAPEDRWEGAQGTCWLLVPADAATPADNSPAPSSVPPGTSVRAS